MSFAITAVVASSALAAGSSAYSAHEANENQPQVDPAYQKFVNQAAQLDTEATQEQADFYKYGTIDPYGDSPVRPYKEVKNGTFGYYIDTYRGRDMPLDEAKYTELSQNKKHPIESQEYGGQIRYEWVDVDEAPSNGVAALEESKLGTATKMQDDLTESGFFDSLVDYANQELGLESQRLDEESKILPQRYEAEGAELQGRIDVAPSDTAAAIAKNKYTTDYTPYKTEADIASAQEQTNMIGLRAPVMSEYFSQVMEGVNPKESMDSATAEVMQANDATKASMTRDAMAMGIEPGSEKWNSMMSEDRNQQTGAIADARTAAKNEAEDTSFSRLSGAMNVGA